MSELVMRHAWLQKHPTPVAERGEFHWYPSEGDRDLRASFVERAAGLDAPAVLWHLAPGRVAWAQLFAATSPSDARRYTGIVLSIAERAGASAAALLEAMAVPSPGPHGTPAVSIEALAPDRAAIARALLAGDVVGARQVHAVSPRSVAALERLLPGELRASPRDGGCRDGEHAMRDVAAELLAAAAGDRASHAARAWTLACELAGVMRRTVDDVLAELGTLWADAALTRDERSTLGHAGDFPALLNAWGRGRLDDSPTAATLAARLADAVALRALARLVEGDDPARAIAEARWYALLPARRRDELVQQLVVRAPSLRALVEGRHA